MPTTTPPANTPAAHARYPDLPVGALTEVSPYHNEALPGRHARVIEVYEWGTAVLVEFGLDGRLVRQYVWDTQLTVV